jgi:hypothetical protein
MNKEEKDFFRYYKEELNRLMKSDYDFQIIVSNGDGQKTKTFFSLQNVFNMKIIHS